MLRESLFYLVLSIDRARALPIGGAVDSSYDAWATALSDVGPLILLIGERSTKQLLRDVRGLSGAFSLAAAPLGLVSIVTSLFRMSGSHRIRSFLGYEQESRSVAALEMSRVNCNGIHPELVDGYLVRTTAATSTLHSGAIGVSTLQSTLSEETVRDVVTQLNSCHAYEAAKRRLHVPSADAKLRWCSQILVEDKEKDDLSDQLLELISAATQVDLLDQKSETLRNELRHTLGLDIGRTSTPTKGKLDGIKISIRGGDTISVVITFDAISEYCTANATSRKISFLIGSISLALIMSLYVLELRYSLAWRLSTGWILSVLGYIGIVVFCTLAAQHIQRSSHSIPLRPRNGHLSQPWKDGLVIAAQSDSKNGAEMLTAASGGRQSFEAMWLRPLTSWMCIKADFIGTCLTLSFLCHYLGLRSSTWWLGLSELVICISAAFARSLTKSRPVKFRPQIGDKSQARLDWRCCGTGLITVHNATEVDTPRRSRIPLDLRIYSSDVSSIQPAVAESIAWYTAVLCSRESHLTSWILETTGMRLWLTRSNQQYEPHAVVVSFSSGILVQEGVASTDVGMCLAFSCNTTGLAAPTAWFARAIMRQPHWRVNRKAFVSLTDTVGKVHIPSLSSIMTWWTVSELRNGPEDNQENLQWAFLLLSTVFFCLLQSSPTHTASKSREALVNSMAALHKATNPGAETAAQAFFERIKSEQQNATTSGSQSIPI